MNRLEQRLAKEAKLSASGARALLTYDSESGLFRWKSDRSHRVKAGDIAGGRSGEYLSIEIADVKYRAHRLAWLIVHGRWPENDIDHVNRNKRDNRLCNLREATRSQNCSNRTWTAGVSGFRGVYWHARNKKWIARVSKKYLGSFESISDAHSAYTSAAAEMYGAFA